MEDYGRWKKDAVGFRMGKQDFFAREHTDLLGELPGADSQMTIGFFMLRPVKCRETNHSQMTTGFFMLQSWVIVSEEWAKVN